jgi:hypothetical protein
MGEYDEMFTLMLRIYAGIFVVILIAIFGLGYWMGGR